MKKVNAFMTVIAALCLCGATAAAQTEKTPTFPRGEGVNLRILDDNVWDYSSDKIPDSWKGLPADPRDPERSKGFARLIGDYMPDVMTFQEYSNHMHSYLMPKIEGWGYVYANPDESLPKNDTRIFYNRNTMELVDAQYEVFRPKMWSNHDSKSFSSAVFIHKATGRYVGVISTHLWWKSESVQKGSDFARAGQAALVAAQAMQIQAKYDCPVFIAGDMNARENTLAVKMYFEAGFKPCYKIATEFADDHNGHHNCFPNSGYSRDNDTAHPTRESGAIDHCLLKDPNGIVQIRRFDCVMDDYTLPLTDHYPNVIDAVVK